MTAISAQQVASLRSRTGVGMLAVKKALEEAQGDEEKAIELLRKRGEAQAVKKGDRSQSEGMVFAELAQGKAALVLLSCETDFVARGDAFAEAGQALAKIALEQGKDNTKEEAAKMIPELVNTLGENVSLSDVQVIEGDTLGVYVHSNGKIAAVIGLQGGNETTARDIAMHAAAMAPEVVSPDDIPIASVEKEKEIWREQLTKEGKPEEIQKKIMVGKEKKFREENALLTQAFVKDPSQTVNQILDAASVSAYLRLAV